MKAFFEPTRPHGNVVFNFRRNPIKDLTAFAVGYRRAAEALAAKFQTEAYADYDGYPVLYLYRHSLELYLKAVVYRGARLMNLLGQNSPETPGLFKQHGLRPLLPATTAIFKAMGWTFDETNLKSLEGFARVIADVDGVDSGSYAFRYPINKTGQSNLPHHFVVNVPQFSEVLNELLDYLEAAAELLEENFQVEAEARYEVQQLLDSWSQEE